MPCWIASLLKEMDAKTQTHRLECQDAQPFILVGQDGAPFTVFGLSKGCFFSSPFFMVGSVNEKNHCAVLEVLLPCCCGCKLFHTEARVCIDLTCFCGIQMINTPVFECLQQSFITTDQICLPFMLTKNDPPKTICKIERKEIQHIETISVYYAGPDPEVELILYTNKEIISLVIPRDGFQSMTVCNLQSIEIQVPIECVNGMIDVQFNFREEKTIYF